MSVARCYPRRHPRPHRYGDRSMRAVSDSRAPARPRRRWWLIISLSVLGFIIIGLVAGRIFLGSPYAARVASERLSATLGMPVRVASVSPGLGSTAVERVELGEA